MTGFDFQQLFLLMKKNISYYTDLIYSKYLLLIIYLFLLYLPLTSNYTFTQKNHFIASTVVTELIDVSCIASKDIAARR